MAPFQQLPFEDLPLLPRVPHAWGELAAQRLRVETEAWGAVEVAFRSVGAGPPLLLVHGLMTAGYSWRYVVAPLARQYTVFVPDLPGSGASATPPGPYAPDDLALAVGAIQRALGIRGCRVIGNSLGGYLCMRLVLRDPAAIGRLVNLHSPGVPLARLWALRAAMSVPGSDRLLRWLVHRDPERWVHRNVHYYDETLKSREETQEYAAPLASDAGVAAFAQILRQTLDPLEMRRFGAALRAAPFPVPLLLLYAERDPMVPPAVGDRLRAWVPNAQFERLSEASHFAHVDAVARFLPPVLRFLEA